MARDFICGSGCHLGEPRPFERVHAGKSFNVVDLPQALGPRITVSSPPAPENLPR